MMKKRALHSKTIWFNVLTVVLVIASFFGFQENQELADQTRIILVSLAPVVNILLRFITKTAIL